MKIYAFAYCLYFSQASIEDSIQNPPSLGPEEYRLSVRISRD